MMAQELDTEFSDGPTSDDEASFVPLEEIEHDPKQVEELVNKLRQVVLKAVRGNHQKPIESAAARLNELGLRAGEAFLDFSGFDEANKRQGYSPLMCACEENKPQIVKVLLEQGASVVYKGKNRSGISPVHIACSKGYEDILKLLLTHATKQQSLRPSLNSTSAKENWTPLMYAVQSGHVNIVNLLLHNEQLQSVETGTVSVEACTKKKENVLQLAAHCRQLDCLEVLHSKQETRGLYLAQDKKGWNVLHYACAGGSVKVVQWLLQNVPELKAAEVLNQMSKNNYTPLLVACEYQKLEVVRYLLREDEGARDVGVRDLSVDASACAMEKDPKTNKIIGRNKTGLHLAAIHDSPEIAQELIAKGCPLDTQDCRGNTALHIAHRKACLDVADILRGAPGGEQLAEIQNQQGKTPDQIPPEDVIPPEIKRRGPKAEEAYRRALRKGKKKILRCGLQILGEQEVGKTSLLRLFTGKNFIENLPRTHGIDNQLVDTVDIRPMSMPLAASPWKEVRPEDQAQQDDALFIDGMVEELAKAGISLNPKREGKQEMPKLNTEEELLGMIEDALRVFKQSPTSLQPRRDRPSYPPAQLSHPPPFFPHLLRGPLSIAQSIPSVMLPPHQLPPQPAPLHPPAASKPEERPKQVEPPKPRERVPRQPSSAPHQRVIENQPPTTDSRKPASGDSNPLVKVSRRIHRSVSQRIKSAAPPQTEPVLHLNTYDFAGQDMYRPMHHCFITRRALYLVVFNLQSMMKYLEKATKDNPLEKIRYWLNSIHAHLLTGSTTKRVLLVGTHRSPKNGRQLTKDDLKQVHDELEKVFYSEDKRSVTCNHLCFICDGKEKQIFAAVENSLDKAEERAASGITTLQEELDRISKDLPFLDEQYPILWLRFERGLLQLREQYIRRSKRILPLVKLEEVKRMGQAYGIEASDVDIALRFFHDTGTIVYLKELSSLFLSDEEKHQLNSLVLLDPEKLMKVMSYVMELRKFKGDPRYLGEEIRDVNRGVVKVSVLEKCWRGCYSESADHGCSFRQLCLILQAYGLIYPLPIVAPPGRTQSEPPRVSPPVTQQQPLRSKSGGDELHSNAQFIVTSMLPKTEVSDDQIPKITFYFDFCGFLLAEIFHRLICLMLKVSASTQPRRKMRDPEFSATRCKFPSVNGRKWEIAMKCHRLKVSVIPRHAENPSPSSYIMLIHREFLKKICDESELQGLTYHGGPFLEKCPRPGCSWRGVLPFVSYPEETDYSTKVICDHCNHECDVDTLLQVTALPSTDQVGDDVPRPAASLSQLEPLPVEELSDDHHTEITKYLKCIETEKPVLVQLGKHLGLRYPRLKKMSESGNFLDELVLSWLRKEDDVIEHGHPSWKKLEEALSAIGQNGIAQTIKQKKNL